MGHVATIGATKFPAQGRFLYNRARVRFHGDARELLGTIVRDDAEMPHRTIIYLDDGRFVLSIECMYSVIDGPKDTVWSKSEAQAT